MNQETETELIRVLASLSSDIEKIRICLEQLVVSGAKYRGYDFNISGLPNVKYPK